MNTMYFPPYHPLQNAIELIWAEVKNWVAAHNVTFKFKGVERFTRHKFEKITVIDWCKKCENIRNCNENLGNQAYLEDAVDSFIINLGVEANDDEDSDSGIMSGVEELAAQL